MEASGEVMDVQASVDAFEAMFRAHHEDLYRYAMRRVGPDAASDVVAEVFLIAWRRRVDIPDDAARLWLYGVASNRVLKEYRGAARRSRLASRLAAEPAVPNDPTEQIDTNTVVRRVLANLSEPDQEALRLTEWEHLSPNEVAAVVGCSPSTFRVRLHRARRRFAAALAKEIGSGRPARNAHQDVTT